MRVKGTRFRDKSAKLRSCGDTFMEHEQFRCDGDADKEYPCTIKGSRSAKPMVDEVGQVWVSYFADWAA
jgi:hypothetical protein